MKKEKELDLKLKKENINKRHIEYYDKVLAILEFILEEYSRELTRADLEFLEMPKNSIATLDFLISSITLKFPPKTDFAFTKLLNKL